MEYRPSTRRVRRRAAPPAFPLLLHPLPLGLAAFALSFFVLLLRGCAIAGQETEEPLPIPEDISAVIAVYDDENDCVRSMPLEEYLCGVVAAEMPASFETEALKAQAIAAHSYALYCRDHAAEPASGWLSVDPVRRQGYLTDAVLRSYWGTAYEENYARLSALVDSVLTDVLYYGNAPAGTSYFAISNGMTEASENVWGTALPYLVAVDSSTDLSADNYLYTVQFTTEQMQQALAGLGLLPDPAAPANWFGEAALTPSGYVASLPVCGQSVTGPALRKALGLRSACFTVQYQEGSFLLTTKGYGHGVGLSQWGAKALAEQGQSAEEILAHYFPGTELRR